MGEANERGKVYKHLRTYPTVNARNEIIQHKPHSTCTSDFQNTVYHHHEVFNFLYREFKEWTWSNDPNMRGIVYAKHELDLVTFKYVAVRLDDVSVVTLQV